MESGDRNPRSAAGRAGRDHDADSREKAADERDHENDIREGVLDRWERELVERAQSLDLFDDTDHGSLDAARRQRAAAHRRRRRDAEDRHEASVERGIEDAHHPKPTDDVRVPSVTALARLTALVAASDTVAETLRAILTIATDAYPDAAAATMSLMLDGGLEPAATTAAWAENLDAAQLRDGVGPLPSSVESRTVIVSDSLIDDDRWHFAGPIGPHADRGVLSAAILVGDDTYGAITLYAEPGRSFDGRATPTATVLAAQASLAIGWTLDRVTHRARSDAWERALASRDQIGQAKGVLMEQRDLTAEAAFELLRATSQDLNAKVRDIAEHVVTHRRLPGPADAPAQPEHRP